MSLASAAASRRAAYAGRGSAACEPASRRRRAPPAQVWRNAPVLYGRNLTGPYENNHTDVPLLAYHTSSTDPSGVRTIEYTVIWSNEDGGTDAPQLMARWGRTTDIEWVYRVRLAPSGRLLSAEYQGPNHETTPFKGLHEARHPLLQTATSNNNVTAVTSKRSASRYRFFLDPSRTLAGRPSARGGDGSQPVDLSGDGEGGARESGGWGATSATTSTSSSTRTRRTRRRRRSAPGSAQRWR